MEYCVSTSFTVVFLPTVTATFSAVITTLPTVEFISSVMGWDASIPAMAVALPLPVISAAPPVVKVCTTTSVRPTLPLAESCVIRTGSSLFSERTVVPSAAATCFTALSPARVRAALFPS